MDCRKLESIINDSKAKAPIAVSTEDSLANSEITMLRNEVNALRKKLKHYERVRRDTQETITQLRNEFVSLVDVPS